MEWVFWAVVGPLTIASLLGCREQRALHRSRQASFRALPLDDRRAVARFLYSGKSLDHRLLPAALDWAQDVLEPECPCNRYLGWAWVLWFMLGAVIAVVFGTARDVAIRFLLLDVVLLAAAGISVTRRRARAVLAAAGRRPAGR